MATLSTILQLAVIWLVSWLMGLGIVKALLPEDLERPYGTLIAPSVGYLAFCFLAFNLSATFGMGAPTACWIALAILCAAGIASQLRPAWRVRPRALAGDARLTLVLILPMALVTLLPLFYFGAQTYLGAVNPDYFAGLVDNYYLAQGHSVVSFLPVTRDTYFPIPYLAGHISASARFGAGVFGLLAHQLLGVPQRTALTLVIGFFLLSFPLTLYFMCRIVLLFEHRAAVLSAWLIGISGSVAMSYLYFYLGQNSGLPALPLLVAACFLMLARPGWRTLVFATLLANALFVNYFAMLPYALAPAGALGLYLVFTRRLSIGRATMLALAFVVVSVVLKLGNVRETMDAMRAWVNVIGQSLQGQFFLEFLTESFFPYFFGVYNYPWNPFYVTLFGPVGMRIWAAAVSAVIFLALVVFVRGWVRATRDMANRVFVLSAFAIYAAVWYRYSFVQQYGYAVFKMSSWLQFIVVPFVAWGFFDLRARLAAGGRSALARAGLAAGLAVCAIYIVLNLVSTLRYDYNGAGRNTLSGLIVNHFGVTGNRDYLELPADIAREVKPGQSIGLMFTDSIRNFWTSYYLRDFRQSILSHVTLPGDDENLPDPGTGFVVDYYGNLHKDQNPFFHGGEADDFVLTWGVKDLNQDIVAPKFAGPPVWSDDSFRLYRASDAKDILFTGRGFYRLEFFPPIAAYFYPRVIRWSADGGEFFLMHVSSPGADYRLAFDAIVGYEYPTDSRTLEIWMDGRKLQDIVVTHSARVVTEPFQPGAGIHKLVVKIRERNKPLPRELALWNRDIPKDYRRQNVGFADVSILPPHAPAPAAPALGERVGTIDFMHRYASQFDAVQLDGWLGATPARFVSCAPAGAKALRIDGYLPPDLHFAMPYALKVRVDGHEYERPIGAAGPFSVEVPLEAGSSETTFEIVPGPSADLHDEAIRHKKLRLSLRLDAFTFR